MKLFITIVAFLFTLTAAQAQYAPQAGVSGTTAIPASSPLFIGWATGCTVQRGYQDITDPGQGYVSAGTDNNGSGPANGTIVSLGDSGIAVLSFSGSIFNGPGPDFAVFENGFSDPSDPEMAFLELAFVEVSSDGLNYFRFPAHSLTPLSSQVPMAGVFMDAKLINNFAGKYIANFGTPFDLDELSGLTGLDINNITHIRLVDVIGALSSLHGSIDSAGNIINDPYPSAIPTGGFDLDAVGVIHMNTNSVSGPGKRTYSIYPNPATDVVHIQADGDIAARLFDISGNLVTTGCSKMQLDVNLDAACSPGFYYLEVIISSSNATIRCLEKLIVY
jgi:hypothetical protein